jgi:hypothetical protein
LAVCHSKFSVRCNVEVFFVEVASVFFVEVEPTNIVEVAPVVSVTYDVDEDEGDADEDEDIADDDEDEDIADEDEDEEDFAPAPLMVTSFDTRGNVFGLSLVFSCFLAKDLAALTSAALTSAALT